MEDTKNATNANTSTTRDDTNKNVGNSPRPPRIMSIQERKRMMQSRRDDLLQSKKGSRSNSNVSTGTYASSKTVETIETETASMPKLDVSMKPRFNPRLNHELKENGNISSLDPDLSSALNAIHSSSSRSVSRYSSSKDDTNTKADGNGNGGSRSSHSQICGSFFGSGASRSISNLFNAEHSQSIIQYDSKDGNTNSSNKKRARNIDALLNDHQVNDNDPTFKSPTANHQHSLYSKPKTPSSLFGEIMKRTDNQLESFADNDAYSNNQIHNNQSTAATDIDIDIDEILYSTNHNGRFGGNIHRDDGNVIVEDSNLPNDRTSNATASSSSSSFGKPYDFASTLVLERNPPRKSQSRETRIQPPPIVRTIPSTNAQHEHDILYNSNTVPPASNVPSLAPRRKNIFKQYSKSSKALDPPPKPKHPTILSSPSKQINATNNGSPKQRMTNFQTQSTPTRYSSPSKLKPSSYGTPKRSILNQKGHVMWDPTTPTHNSDSRTSIFHRASLNSNSNVTNHKTPPRSKPSTSVNWDPKTPDTAHRSGHAMTPNKYYNSPGGFALQRMLDGCMSPQLQISHWKEEKKIDEGNGHGRGNDLFHPRSDPAPQWEEQRDGGSRSSLGSVGLRDMEGWDECWLRIPSIMGKHLEADSGTAGLGVSGFLRGEVGSVDWSIKSEVKIECFPQTCVPGDPLSNLRQGGLDLAFGEVVDHDKVERLAMDLFLNPDKDVPSFTVHGGQVKEQEELVLAQWKAAQMYWQHPAMHPLPPSVIPNVRRSKSMGKRSSFVRSSSIESFRGNTSSNLPSMAAGNGGVLHRQASLPSFSMQADSASSKLSSSTLGKAMQVDNTIPLVDSVRGAEAPLRQAKTRSGIGTLGGLGHTNLDEKYVSTVPVMLQQRNDEWQECFRSLFFTWIRRVEELGQESDETMDSSSLSRCSFYSIAPDRTVLFRPSFDNGDDKETSCLPLIVISSSTKPMRCALRSMGIKIKMKTVPDSTNEKNQAFEVLSEDFVERWLETKENKEDSDTSQVHQELEALRRATTLESVGAEVSISMLNRSKSKDKGKKSTQIFSPLIIEGFDNCMAFYEIFLNSIGNLGCFEGDNSATDVPLLICRSLGPGRYMTLRQLSSSTSRAQQDAPNDDKEQHQLSSIVLNGPVMPCSFRDLLCASATHFSLHKHRSCSPKNMRTTDDNDAIVDENILGSHYFMMQLINQGNKQSESKNIDVNSRKLGSSGSMWFNGLTECHVLGGTNDAGMPANENKQGETCTMAVWDVNRPFSIAYRSSRPEELQSTAMKI